MPDHHARLPLWDERDATQKLDLLKTQIEDLYGFLFRPAYRHLAALLDNHTPANDEEAHSIEQIRQMMKRYPNIFSPVCEAGHITGSALVIHPESKRMLLTHHAKLQRWLQMGGHTEYELDPAETALREAREESGLPDLRFYPDSGAGPIDIDVHLIPARNDIPAHYHLDIRYLLATKTPEAVQITPESHDLRWFDLDGDLAQLNLDSSLIRLVEKARRAIS